MKGIVVFDATMCTEVWEASFGEALICERERENASDRCTIAVIGKPIPDVEIVMNRARYY